MLKHPELLRLDIGICIQHTILTASFVVLPLALTKQAGLSPHQHWQLYLPVLALAFLAMIPFVILAEKKRLIKPVFIGAIALLALTQGALSFLHDSTLAIAAALFPFFAAFSLLEALLPSLISKIAPLDSKGTAMGIYSSSQFFGIFLGGTLGGLVLSRFGITPVFWFCTILAILWGLTAMGMQKPKHLSTKVLDTGPLDEATARQLSRQLNEITGVAEAVIRIDEATVYLKVDKAQLDEEALTQRLKAHFLKI